MRVCLVVPYDLADEGGVKRHAQHLAACLRRRGDDVTLVGPLRRGEPGPGVHGFGGVVNIPANGAANYVALLTPPWAVRRFFEERAFDVVHLHEPLVPILTYYALWFSPRAAHVVTFHMYSEDESKAWRALRRRLAALMRARIDRAIAVSRAAEGFARQWWDGPLAVIPNGVPVSAFRGPAPAPGPDPPRPTRLLFVGNWRDPRKGLAFLIAACGRLRGQGVAVTLDVVGAGPPGEVERAEGVTYHGPVSSEEALARLYHACDVFVAPATGQESFGIVLLEAMAAGRPVVCSDIAGYRDVVSAEGALLVAPADVEGLGEAIRALAADAARRRRMGDVNRRAVEPYDWEPLSDRVRDQYLEARTAASRRVAPCRT